MRAIERIWETMTKRRNNNPQVLSSVDAKVEGQLHIEDSVVLEGGPDQESALLASDDGALSVNGREVVTLDEEGNLPYDVAVPDLANVLAGKANVNHTHTIEDVIGLGSGGAGGGGPVAISDVQGLEDALTSLGWIYTFGSPNLYQFSGGYIATVTNGKLQSSTTVGQAQYSIGSLISWGCGPSTVSTPTKIFIVSTSGGTTRTVRVYDPNAEADFIGGKFVTRLTDFSSLSSTFVLDPLGENIYFREPGMMESGDFGFSIKRFGYLTGSVETVYTEAADFTGSNEVLAISPNGKIAWSNGTKVYQATLTNIAATKTQVLDIGDAPTFPLTNWVVGNPLKYSSDGTVLAGRGYSSMFGPAQTFAINLTNNETNYYAFGLPGSAGGSFSGGETVVGAWRNGSDFGATVVRSQAGPSNKNVSSYIKYGPGSLEPAPTAKWLENQNNPVGRYWAPFGA